MGNYSMLRNSAEAANGPRVLEQGPRPAAKNSDRDVDVHVINLEPEDQGSCKPNSVEAPPARRCRRVQATVHIDADEPMAAAARDEDAWATGRTPPRAKWLRVAQAPQDLSQNGYGLCNNASGQEIGIPDRISAGF